MDTVHLDTHVVVCLFAGALEQIPDPVRQRLNSSALEMSAIVALELHWLHETDRLAVAPQDLVEDLRHRVGLRVADISTRELVANAATMNWTRDPFDRLIAAHAMAANRTLLTRDRQLRKNFDLACWD